MSNTEILDVRVCHFPGCDRLAVAGSPGVGRPAQYCDDPTHNRGSAWRARKTAALLPGTVEVADPRPLESARLRASALHGQTAGMIELLQQQLNSLVAELHTLADPDAAEAHIQSVTADAAEKVAAETARATRAEEGRWDADALRGEADAAAEEATVVAEVAAAALVEANRRVTELESGLTEATRQLEEAATEIGALKEQVATSAESLTVTTVERDAARAELVVVATERDKVAGDLVVSLAAVASLTGERDNAVAETAREKDYAEQRVAELRTTFKNELDRVRADLGQAQGEAREQRTRADVAEARTR